MNLSRKTPKRALKWESHSSCSVASVQRTLESSWSNFQRAVDPLRGIFSSFIRSSGSSELTPAILAILDTFLGVGFHLTVQQTGSQKSNCRNWGQQKLLSGNAFFPNMPPSLELDLPLNIWGKCIFWHQFLLIWGPRINFVQYECPKKMFLWNTLQCTASPPAYI